MSNTAVNEKDLPTPEAKLINAPVDLDTAIERILELEMRLEDLVRACEIATITRQIEMIDSFAGIANDTLANKILIQQPSAEDLKLTVITNNKEDAKT
jgi:hypothetical protein